MFVGKQVKRFVVLYTSGLVDLTICGFVYKWFCSLTLLVVLWVSGFVYFYLVGSK